MTSSVGKRIEEARKGRKLTQKELANMVGMSQQAFAALEKRDTAPKKLYEISEALGVSAEYLRTGKESNASHIAVARPAENSFTCEEVEEIIPIALERTVVALTKQLAQNGERLDLYKHQNLISEFLSASVAVELSGDYELITRAFERLKATK
ncbi:helix-turn-helix transcriptional regulator [Pseudoalteromonas rubra]|uniref:helix-turn-helix domain-containing protein n=1 Tax=Pseudoalteromonas rubra TaxID=43658 RepID=UPI002DB78517|nr:helix-turn-helix transcriptional regulator [Pseudoalteromonas rubra]MEC4091137.1 helix-turn-helix transcriptional regulator [Pseudoalteromonas rubra]